MRHQTRIGLGVQGLADTFHKTSRLPFTSSEEAQDPLNQEIFETIYFAAVTASMEESQKKMDLTNHIKGLQFRRVNFNLILWGIKDEDLSGRWDWSKVCEEMM